MELVNGNAPFKALRIDMAVLGYLNLKPFRERVNNRGAYAVKTARNLIARAAEFTAGVKNSKYNRNGGNTRFFVNTRWNSSSVIAYGNNVAGENFRFYMGTNARKRLVYGVINNLIYKVVESPRTR